MSTTPSLLALLAVLTLAMLAGCKTGEADDEPAPVAQEGTPEGEAPGRRPQAGDDVQQQKLEVLVQGFLDNARAALAEGNLEAAHEALSHAFEIDPSNRYVFVPFVERSGGPNAVGQFTFEAKTGALAWNRPAFLSLTIHL